MFSLGKIFFGDPPVPFGPLYHVVLFIVKGPYGTTVLCIVKGPYGTGTEPVQNQLVLSFEIKVFSSSFSFPSPLSLSPSLHTLSPYLSSYTLYDTMISLLCYITYKYYCYL